MIMILVIGGSGHLGRKVVELLRAESRTVRVLTRDPARAAFHDPGVDVVQGDLLDRDSLAAAVTDVESIVVTAHGGHGTGKDGPGGIEGQGLPHVLEAVRSQSLRQFVYISTASARPDSPADFFRAKAEVERLLRTSPVPHTILRPTHLLDTWVPLLAEPLVKKSRELIIGRGENPVSWVAASDVAQAAARLAVEDGDGYTAELGGPEALTLRELSARIQHELAIVPRKTSVMPPGMLRLLSAVVRPVNRVASRQMLLGALLDTRPQVVDASAVWERLGVDPVAVTPWLRANLPAVAASWQAAAAGRRGPLPAAPSENA
jgi:uncharacterized protein YbjT (DUF2867 family)